MTKVKRPFLYALAIVSVLGFLTIALNSLNIFDIGSYVTALIFVVLGIGMMFEGNVRMLLKYAKKGFTESEISHITAVVIGFLAVISGLLSMPFIGFQSATFDSFKGVIAIIAIFVIIIETVFIK